MGRKAGGLWPAVTVTAIVVGTIWLVYAVWRSPHRDDLSTFWSFAAAVVVIAAGLINRAWRAGLRQRGDVAQALELDRLSDLLARAVKDQWTRAAGDRGLLEPEPIPVRWRKPSSPLSGPASAAVRSQRFAPLPGLQAVGLQRLRAGQIPDLHAVYGGLGSGRLVIAGAPGSGKSGAAVLLVLAALRHREQVPEKDHARVPVPVMFTLHGWNPNTRPVQDWLAERLQQTYLLLPNKGGVTADALLAAGRIAVILDGLDEIPETLRPVALRALSQQATFRLVILTRSIEMTAAASQSLLEGAAAVELQDIDPKTAAAYLTRVQIDPPPHGWHDLTDRLRDAPDSPISHALNSPLTLTLVRDTYRNGDDIFELLEFCDAADRPVCREDIVDFLLDRVLPAAYAQRPGQSPPRYDLQTAQNAMCHIAVRLNQDGTRDLQWWRIRTWTPAAPSIIATGLAVGLLSGLVVGYLNSLLTGLTLKLVSGLVAGLVTGLAAGLAGGRGRGSPRRIAPARRRPVWRRVFRRPMFACAFTFTFASAFGLVQGFGQDLLTGLLAGLVAAFGFTFACGIGKSFPRPGADDASPLSPLTSWRSDRASGLVFGLLTGLAIGLLSGLALGLENELAGLAAGLALGLVLGITYPAAWSASLASAQLAARWHTPVRLMRFLEDARDRNVLRTVGPVYQFRHAQLQDRLAKQANAPRRS